tara:strand:+ start:442 stop:696 length:255 start_codon:yes stop_codon:yes gene_type:complete
MTKSDFKKSIKKFFVKESGMSIAAAKVKIRNQMKVWEYDTSINIKGVRFYYSANPNYAEGGTGWYMSNAKMSGSGSVVKIAKSF